MSSVIAIVGEETAVQIIFGLVGAESILGVATLESTGLVVDLVGATFWLTKSLKCPSAA